MSTADWEAQDYRDRGILLRIRALEAAVEKLKASDWDKTEQIRVLQQKLLEQEGQRVYHE